jgi:hypothetical protein
MAGARGLVLRSGGVTLACAAIVASAACGGGAKKPVATPATLHFRSRPDLRPPVVTVLHPAKDVAPGFVFIAPKASDPQQGPEILDNSGEPVWFDPLGKEATDFRVQTYRGEPVLAWWEGPPTAPVSGTGIGHYVIMNSSYRVIARVQTGYGPNTGDLHEFQLTPQGRALVTIDRIVPYDLTPVGGPKNGLAVDGVIQEIDVATGRILFTWHSLAHVGVDEGETKPPPASGAASKTPYDYFHINSIDQEPDGDLLVSARNTHAVYEIDPRTGAVVWRLGGKDSSFAMGAGTTFAWQHDARLQPDGTITLFDDGAAPPVEEQSRAIRIRLDTHKMTATLVQADTSPDGVLSTSQGNVQTLPDGHLFVGWGSVPRFTEFDRDGRVVYDATFSAGDDSYRAYRFTWAGTPTSRPALAAVAGGSTTTLYASWNGATQVARWRILGGPDATHLTVAGTRPRTGFETTIKVRSHAQLFAVEALDATGRILSTSAPTKR